MAIKKYIVREGFTYHEITEAGQDRALFEGDTIEMPEEIGNTTHQLELAVSKARAKATTAEEKPDNT